MEKPIEYYEVALEYAKANGVAVSDEEIAELIAMVKARDNEIARLNGQSMFLCQCGGVNSLAAQNATLQTQLSQQLCVTRTLEKEIEQLRQVNRASGLLLAGIAGAANAHRNEDIEVNIFALHKRIAELKELKKDKLRLDMLDTFREGYGFEDTHEGNTWHIYGQFINVRQAIDAAIASQQGGEVK